MPTENNPVDSTLGMVLSTYIRPITTSVIREVKQPAGIDPGNVCSRLARGLFGLPPYPHFFLSPFYLLVISCLSPGHISATFSNDLSLLSHKCVLLPLRSDPVYLSEVSFHTRTSVIFHSRGE